MRKPSLSLIGIFVIGAIVLAMAGLIVLGAGRFFSRNPTFVMYFEGSVKGLSSGAPVVFKGVKVGSVGRIGLLYDPTTRLVRIVVLTDIDLGSITRPGGEPVTERFFLDLIRQGLKAQLQYQNYVTGQLLINLDFYPGRPARFARTNLAYPEIPTAPSSLEQLSKAVENVPLDEVVQKLSSAIEGISRTATSPELKQTLRSLSLAVSEIQELTRTVNKSISPLTRDARATLAATRDAMVQTEKTLASLEKTGSAGSPVVEQLLESLEKVSDAADSLRALSDYLNRHPEALIRGKRAGG